MIYKKLAFEVLSIKIENEVSLTRGVK